MDPDINIVRRQMAEDNKEKYYLINRVKELSEEVDRLKARLKQLENPDTISGDERTW